MKFNRPFLRSLAGWSVLVVVPLLLFAKPILRGEILIPTDILPVIDGVWAEKTTPNNPLLSDVILQFYPWQKFAAQTIAQGQLPLWNPYMMAGAPFLANDQSSIFDPLRFLTLITRFPVEHSFLFLAVGRLVLFGVFIAWWLRLRGFNKGTAVLIGAAGSLSAPAIVWLPYPLFATFLWLPFLLVGLEYLSRRERRGWLITAGAVAAQWFSGNIQISIFILLFSALYTLLVLRPTRRTMIMMSVAVILGTGVAAVQLLPTASYVRQSPVAEAGRGGYGGQNAWTMIRDGSWRGWDSVADARQSIERVLPVISPFLNGNPASGKYRFPNGDVYANMNELAVSAGSVLMVLSIVGVFVAWADRLVRFLFASKIFALGVIAHVPGLELVNVLPFINQTQTGRLRFLIAFCTVGLAAFGLRALLTRTASRKLFALVSGVAVTLLVGLGWTLGVGSDWKIDLVMAVASLSFIGAAMTVKIVALRSGLVALAVLAGPLVLWSDYHTSVNPKSEILASPIIDALNSRSTNDSRIVSFGLGRGRTPLEPNTAMVYGLLDVRGYDVVRLKRYDEFVDGVLTRSGSHLKGATKPSEILNVLSVRYGLVATRDLATLDPVLQADGWTVVTEDANVRLYENTKWKPRAWFTSNIQEVSDTMTSLTAVRADTFSADVPVIETGKNIPTVSGGVTAPVVINYSDPNEVSITVKAPQSGYVILADAFADGWVATVNGRQTKIFPTNHALRGVSVTAGEQQIIFSYHPEEVAQGIVVSLASVLGLLALFWVTTKRQPV